MRTRENSSVLKRSWSLLILAIFFCLPFFRIGQSEPGRAVLAVLSLGLVVQCWFAQRPFLNTRAGVVLLSLALSLPALGSLWLGLNVVRFYSYTPESGTSVYGTVVLLQEIIEKCALVVGLVVFYWSTGEGASFLGKQISRRFVGRKKRWWNTPLKGTWMLGSLIGFAVSALIASSLLRWGLIALALLGCIFALIFRMSRNQSEI